MIEDGKLNLQKELIENHQAQLTVEIEAQQLEAAKKKAARKISREVQIRGFRKGKAPYRLVAQYVGEAAILEEAVEILSGDLYPKALEESQSQPYGPGSVADFKLEPVPTMVFTVPLQPEVELNNYQDVRVDFEAPVVEDEVIEEMLQKMRFDELEVLDDQLAVAELGSRVHLLIESNFLDGEEPDDEEIELDGEDSDASDKDASDKGEADEADEGESADDLWDKDDDKPYVPRKGETFVYEENKEVILDPDDDPILEGFVAAIVGAELDSDIEFELTVPADDADKTRANRRIGFLVAVNKIESIRIPELDDAFAESVSKNLGEEAMGLDSLRAVIRADLEREALQEAKSEYSQKVMDKIIAGAEIHYPEMMQAHRVQELISEFTQRLKRQQLSLKDYFRFSGDTMESLQQQYQEPAAASLKQSLVFGELVSEEEVETTTEQVDLWLDLLISRIAGGEALFSQMYDRMKMRPDIHNELIINQVNERLYAIGRGEDPDKAVDLFFQQMSDDLEREQKRKERLRGDQEGDEPQDSEASNGDEPATDEPATDEKEPDPAALPLSAAAAANPDAAAARDGEAADIDNSADGAYDD